MKLKNCPFCGSELEYDHPDCIYPVGKPEYNEETDELYYPLWQISCHRGSCGGNPSWRFKRGLCEAVECEV